MTHPLEFSTPVAVFSGLVHYAKTHDALAQNLAEMSAEFGISDPDQIEGHPIASERDALLHLIGEIAGNKAALAEFILAQHGEGALNRALEIIGVETAGCL